MTAWTLFLIVLCECASIAGQIFFKHAMTEHWSKSRRKAAWILSAGIGAMAVNFFIWLSLLANFELSRLYPFEGLNRVVLLCAAAIFLREKIPPQLWIGVVLISAGVALVFIS
ncbi:MAG TPA: EamA family transporter [Chthoniobacteraceae bacterium]|nr:EamA family transporter [Chthoniobacteraceae bacterium]